IKPLSANFSGSGISSAVTVQLLNLGNASFSGSGTFNAPTEEFTAPELPADFIGGGITSANVVPLIVGGFSGSGETVAGLGIFAGAVGSGTLNAALTKVGLLSA